MEQYAVLFEELFKQIRMAGEYKGYKLNENIADLHKQMHSISGIQFLASFVQDSQVPIQDTWAASTWTGKPFFFRLEMLIKNDLESQHIDRIKENREVIEKAIGLELDWERRDGTTAGGPKTKRSIVALYYKKDDNYSDRIKWTMNYAKPFIDTLTNYS